MCEGGKAGGEVGVWREKGCTEGVCERMPQQWANTMKDSSLGRLLSRLPVAALSL